MNNVYADSFEDLAKLRLHSGGLFRLDDLNQFPFNESGVPTAGDIQFNQNSGLQSVHVLFYRLHNMIAKYLAAHYTHWDDHVLFFETRRIVIAIYQHIVYYEWLPLVLGIGFCC